MPHTSQLNQAQRQAFEKTLHEKLREANSSLSEKVRDAETIALQKLIEKKGIMELVNTVKTLRDQLEVSEKELDTHGFEIRNDGEIRINYAAPDELREEHDALIEEQVAEDRQKVESIRRALENSWQVATLDEAKQAVAAFA